MGWAKSANAGRRPSTYQAPAPAGMPLREPAAGLGIGPTPGSRATPATAKAALPTRERSSSTAESKAKIVSASRFFSVYML